MLELLLDKNLSGSQPGSDVREVARARTLTALRRVGNKRKCEVLRFLHEAGLIYRGKAIVDLREADLSRADLSNIKLSGADLNNALLNGANLKGANLRGAIYSAEQLSKALIQVE